MPMTACRKCNCYVYGVGFVATCPFCGAKYVWDGEDFREPDIRFRLQKISGKEGIFLVGRGPGGVSMYCEIDFLGNTPIEEISDIHELGRAMTIKLAEGKRLILQAFAARPHRDSSPFPGPGRE